MSRMFLQVLSCLSTASSSALDHGLFSNTSLFARILLRLTRGVVVEYLESYFFTQFPHKFEDQHACERASVSRQACVS